MERDLFAHICKSPRTAELYKLAVAKFEKESGVTLKTADPKKIQGALIDLIIDLKQKGQSRSSQAILYSAVQKYCDAYDIEGINFKKVRKYLSEASANGSDRTYTKAELQKMVAAADVRTRAIILTMLSSGMRIGALPELKLKHLEKLENDIYQVTVYPDSKKDRYKTFTSPEATNAIDAYLSMRRTMGEEITPESWLFRKTFDAVNATTPQPITRPAIAGVIADLTERMGIRPVLKSKKDRHEMSLTHSFRKYANTAFVKAGVKAVVCEMLLGHNIGLQRNYLRLNDDEMLAEYMKSLDLLTVSDEKNLRAQVEKLKVEMSDVNAIKRAYVDMKLELERKEQEMQPRIEAAVEKKIEEIMRRVDVSKLRT